MFRLTNFQVHRKRKPCSKFTYTSIVSMSVAVAFVLFLVRSLFKFLHRKWIQHCTSEWSEVVLRIMPVVDKLKLNNKLIVKLCFKQFTLVFLDILNYLWFFFCIFFWLLRKNVMEKSPALQLNSGLWFFFFFKGLIECVVFCDQIADRLGIVFLIVYLIVQLSIKWIVLWLIKFWCNLVMCKKL